jgi:hypothetical protein
MNTTRLKLQVVILASLSLAPLPTIATPYDGEDHVVDTEKKVAQNSITLTTTANKVITLTFTEGKQ